MTTVVRMFAVVGTLVLLGAGAACGGQPANAPAPVSAPVASAPAPSDAPSASGTAPASRRVSANTASEQQIAEALQAAGVRNAKRWAEEVVEYRPYPLDDPNLSKLREKLAKYNPGQDTTDKIVSALTP